MDAIELFSKDIQERKKLEKNFLNITYSEAYLNLISLNNLCECHLQRRKVKKKILAGLINNALLVKEYFVESEGEHACIPDKQMLTNQYIAALKSVGRIPPQLETLYQKACEYKGKSGRAKESVKERTTKSGFVGALMALVYLEKNFKLGIFPIHTREEARQEFYRQINGGEGVPPCGGGREIFNIHLKAIKKELHHAEAILISYQANGTFSSKVFIDRYQGRLPAYETAAHWFFAMIRYSVWYHW